jgi:Fe2+ or Zn2+ uptake regulation protein
MAHLICRLCDKDGDALLRVNEHGVHGIFVCLDCRPKFERRLQSTDDVLTRLYDLKMRNAAPSSERRLI